MLTLVKGMETLNQTYRRFIVSCLQKNQLDKKIKSPASFYIKVIEHN